MPTAKERRPWLDEPIRGVLIDITGVLYNSTPSGGEPIEGSVEAWNRIKSSPIPVRLCTNDTTVSRQLLASKLSRLGFDVCEEDIVCPAPVAKRLMIDRGWRPFLLVHEDVLPEFQGMDQTNPNCVLIGDAAEYFTYENMNKAFQTLLSMDSPHLLTMGQGKYHKDNGKLTLDVGAYKVALEFATGVEAKVVGKPSGSYFSEAVSLLGVQKTKVVMIGDDIVNDVGGAQACGLRGVQVRTGKFRPQDEQRTDVTPDAFVNNLAEAIEVILNTQV